MGRWQKNLADLMYSEEPENISDLRDTYIELLRQYYYVGGMPEVVQAYADNQNLQNVRHIQNRIISNYETAIEWLKDAGLIYQVTRINNFTKPLNFYEDFSAFKIYSLDLGLLGAMAQTDPADILTKNTGFVEYKGAFTEQWEDEFMNAQECLKMLREIRDVSFATVDENGMPHNRIIDVMIVEENRLVFCTGRGKDFYRQLTANPHVAISGLNKNWQMIRLNGTVTKLEDQKKWIDRIFDENPSMNDVYPGEARYILDPFAIESGYVEFFDLGTSPIHRESFSFGESRVPEKGFRITDACIGCGTCQVNCPQQSIEEGTPFAIRQDSCLHCGLCFENCPVQAIVRRGEKNGSGCF